MEMRLAGFGRRAMEEGSAATFLVTQSGRMARAEKLSGAGSQRSWFSTTIFSSMLYGTLMNGFMPGRRRPCRVQSSNGMDRSHPLPSNSPSIFCKRWLSSSVEPFGSAGKDLVIIRDLKLKCIIGCNPDERDRLQDLIVNVHVWTDLRASMGRHIKQCDILEVQVNRADATDWGMHAAGELAGTVNYSLITKISKRIAVEGKFFTIEAMAQCIARAIIVECDAARVQVTLDKPEALAKKGVAAAACQVTRSREDFMFAHNVSHGVAQPTSMKKNPKQASRSVRVVRSEPQALHPRVAHLALGSNVGDGAQQIQHALRLLSASADVQLLATSFMYESPAAYVIDQPVFTNAACKVATSLGPEQLLALCKDVEHTVGREVRYRWGPREVDVDIILYNGETILLPTGGPGSVLPLEIPHPRAHERDFVLGPLCDMDPLQPHPGRSGVSMTSLLSSLLSSFKANSCALTRVIPLRIPLRPNPFVGMSLVGIPMGTTQYVHLTGLRARTAIMGVLNVTPDSFSDGGDHAGIDTALSRIQTMVEQGVDVVDIGGQSTRPNAKIVSVDEELARVIPVIIAARARGVTACISVDTFRAEVARKAVEAGANMINDISGGLLDANMLPTVASLMVPICLMHYRGDPSSMQSLANYPSEGILAAVEEELESRVAAALQAGIPRWNIIIDPGIGFAKSAEQSFDILRGSRALTQLCRPWSGEGNGYAIPGVSSDGFGLLVGASRKSFIGKVLGEPDARSDRRLWGTAAACTAAVEQGACIVRVHDVSEMKDVISVADAIYRR